MGGVSRPADGCEEGAFGNSGVVKPAVMGRRTKVFYLSWALLNTLQLINDCLVEVISHLEGLSQHVAHSRNKMKRYCRPPGSFATALIAYKLAINSFSDTTQVIPSWALRVCDIILV